MNNFRSDGKWDKLDVGYSTAVMAKSANSSTVTVTAQAIRMKATFDSNHHFAAPEFCGHILFCTALWQLTYICITAVEGNLAFSTLSQISTGTMAGSCLDDRIYFSAPGIHDFKAFVRLFSMLVFGSSNIETDNDTAQI